MRRASGNHTLPIGLALAVAMALAAGGCGSGSNSGPSSSATTSASTKAAPAGFVGQPQPAAPIASVVGPFNKALADQSCAEFEALNFSLFRDTLRPGAPPTKSECKFMLSPHGALRVLRGDSFTSSAEFGTAAMMFGPLKGASKREKQVAAVFARDIDGHYRYVSLFRGDKQLGGAPPASNNAQANANAFLTSIKQGHCNPSLLNHGGSLVGVGGTSLAACKSIDKGKHLAPALKGAAQVTPIKMGQTLDLVFYGVPTKKAFYTLIMASQGGSPTGPQTTNYTVIDILPSTPGG